MLAVLFLSTGLGIGIYAFWQATHQPKTDTSSQTQQLDPNALQGKPLANFTPVAKIDSLQKIDTKIGSGAEAKADSTVTVHYTGAVAATGTVFQSSLDGGQPVTFSLSAGLIQGWKEGVPGMKAGSERRLLIPAALGYGINPPAGSGIPPNADLVFDITLLSIQ